MEDETNIWQAWSPVQKGVTVLAEGINTILSRKSGVAYSTVKGGRHMSRIYTILWDSPMA